DVSGPYNPAGSRYAPVYQLHAQHAGGSQPAGSSNARGGTSQATRMAAAAAAMCAATMPRRKAGLPSDAPRKALNTEFTAIASVRAITTTFPSSALNDGPVSDSAIASGRSS